MNQHLRIDSISQYGQLAVRTLAEKVAADTFMTHMNMATGLASETGEINELLKKRYFHFHPWTPENQEHLKKELGDLAWYWVVTCLSHGMDPAEVLATNINKLQARYPEGHFSTERSINRAVGDI